MSQFTIITLGVLGSFVSPEAKLLALSTILNEITFFKMITSAKGRKNLRRVRHWLLSDSSSTSFEIVNLEPLAYTHIYIYIADTLN